MQLYRDSKQHPNAIPHSPKILNDNSSLTTMIMHSMPASSSIIARDSSQGDFLLLSAADSQIEMAKKDFTAAAVGDEVSS